MAVFERKPDGTLLRIQMTEKCLPCGGADHQSAETIPPTEPATVPESDTPAEPTDAAAQPDNDDEEVTTDGAS